MKIKTLAIVALALLCTGTVSAQKKKNSKKAEAVVKAETLTPATPVISVQPVPADSFSYAVGVAQSTGLKTYIKNSLGVEDAYMGDFLRGLQEPYDEEHINKYKAYAAGLEIARQNEEIVYKAMNKQATGSETSDYLIKDLYNKGLVEGLQGTATLKEDSAVAIAERQFKYQQEVYKNLNLQWLEENSKKEGVNTFPNGLQYKILTKGAGVVATDTNTVEVNYEGKLIDGTVFDSSYKRGKSASFKPTQVIKGWSQALTMMPEGSVWELYIPYDLAYGERGNQNIPGYSTLIFKVEIIKVK